MNPPSPPRKSIRSTASKAIHSMRSTLEIVFHPFQEPLATLGLEKSSLVLSMSLVPPPSRLSARDRGSLRSRVVAKLAAEELEASV